MTTQAQVKQSSAHKSPILIAAVGGLSGVAFGAALYKAQVYRPEIIQKQMTMENMTMLKTFVTGVMTGTGVFTGMEALGLTNVSSTPAMWSRNILGGSLLGAGIYLAGSCPGTVFAQLGANLDQAKFVFAGGLLGAYAFSQLQPTISKQLPEDPTKSNSVHQKLGVKRYVVALPLIAIMGAGLYWLEGIAPWQKDSGVALSTTSLSTLSWNAPVWSPYVAGAIIGLLQIPNQYLFNHSLGTSSTFVTLVNTLVHWLPGHGSQFSNHILSGASNLWQPLLTLGIVLGAYLSQNVAKAAPAASVVSGWKGVLAGALLVFGARVANGCTSGHGISGCAKLNIGSMLATAAMFGSGIAVAKLGLKL